MSLKALLLKHYRLYPKMQIQDMIKLIYQNEFAGGHLNVNQKDSLLKLQAETRFLEQLPPDSKASEKAFEDIGNHLCRFYLTALKHNDINIETINTFFINTSNWVHGSVKSFEEKLDVFMKCCKEGLLPYSLEELEAFLSCYKQKGYPPISHSNVYRAAYFPAYRIVKSEYCRFFQVFCRMDSLMKLKDSIIVAIDGNSGAGKSTLALLIGDVYECNIFHMDDFFLTPELRTEERLREVGGNVDYVRFKHEVIDGINGGREFQYRKYDCKQGIFGEPIPVTPKKLNIVEGAYSMHPTLINNYDLKIFLHIDGKEQKFRILKRDGSYMLKRFVSEWIPLENQYFKELNIEGQCNLVFRG